MVMRSPCAVPHGLQRSALVSHRATAEGGEVPDDDMERLYTVDEAAQVLRCSGRTVYREIAAGRLVAKRTRGKILITASALRDHIASLDPPDAAAI